jgi:hypothetical protein
VTDDDRYSRQRRLPQVGDAGQARLGQAALSVAAGPAALYELTYLLRAGVGVVAVEGWRVAEPFVHHAHFRHRAARLLGAGSWRALGKINRILSAAPPAAGSTAAP